MYVTGMAPKYIKTSNNGPSGKQTNSVQWINHFAPIVFTIVLINYQPLRSGHLSTLYKGHSLAPNNHPKLPPKMDSETTTTDKLDACRALS